jgi:purine-nucleoside phosphorylase
MADQVANAKIIPYEDIPGFPQVTVPGHAGRLVLGNWGKHTIAVMQGRFHYYEGHPIDDVVLPIRVMQKLGVPLLLMTNAAGGVDTSFKPGELMLIRDHISLWVDSPLRGANLDEYGPRFPDQSKVYDQQLAEIAVACAEQLNLPLHQGVYAYLRGPQFETPAEIRLLRMLGASAVGMSTVPEALVAIHGGMKILALSCITNLAAGILDQPLNHQEVLEVGNKASARTIQLLNLIIERLP